MYEPGLSVNTVFTDRVEKKNFHKELAILQQN